MKIFVNEILNVITSLTSSPREKKPGNKILI